MVLRKYRSYWCVSSARPFQPFRPKRCDELHRQPASCRRMFRGQRRRHQPHKAALRDEPRSIRVLRRCRFTNPADSPHLSRVGRRIQRRSRRYAAHQFEWLRRICWRNTKRLATSSRCLCCRTCVDPFENDASGYGMVCSRCLQRHERQLRLSAVAHSRHFIAHDRFLRRHRHSGQSGQLDRGGNQPHECRQLLRQSRVDQSSSRNVPRPK